MKPTEIPFNSHYLGTKVLPSPLVSIGIDPGWKNLGFAAVTPDPDAEGLRVKVLVTKALNPSAFESPELFTEQLVGSFSKHFPERSLPTMWTIERYVAYANIHTAESENITTLIGMLRMQARTIWEKGVMFEGLTSFRPDATELIRPLKVSLFRAIDWKVRLVQLLSTYDNFTNPSKDLDKVFSVAAAKHVSGLATITTDHEADAICLAALPILTEQIRAKLKAESERGNA